LNAAGPLDIGSQAGAQAALATTQNLSQTISTQRTETIGASQSRLSAAANVISEARIANTASYSTITDADVAQSSAMLSMQKVQSLAGVAMLAQAKNLNALTVSALLK
jgi:flagellin-like hook-associated protein FlgL